MIYQREEGNQVQEKDSIGLEEDAVPSSIGNLTIQNIADFGKYQYVECN